MGGLLSGNIVPLVLLSITVALVVLIHSALAITTMPGLPVSDVGEITEASPLSELKGICNELSMCNVNQLLNLQLPGLSPQSSSPHYGVITPTNRRVMWVGKAPVPNPTVGLVSSFDPSRCQSLGYCDVFTLYLNVPQDFLKVYPSYYLNITITWQNPLDDYDLYVYYNNTLIASSTQGAGTNSEGVLIPQPKPGVYKIYADNWLAVINTTYVGVATLGLYSPPFVTRSAVYYVQDSKYSGLPFVFTRDIKLVGAQNGGCVVFCAQDVEPGIKIDRFGTIYVAAIEGVPGGVDFWRSTDDGQTFQYLGQPDGAQNPTVSGVIAAGLGGGDEDLAVGEPFVILNSSGVVLKSPGRVYLTSLWLGSVTVSTSINMGNNWVVSQTPYPVVDRQWTAARGASDYYVTFKALVNEILGYTNLVLLQSTDGGLTFTRGAFVGKIIPSTVGALEGPMAVGPDGSVYIVFVGEPQNQIYLAKCPAPCNLPLLPLSATSTPFIVKKVFQGPPNMNTANVFPQLAIDSAGNIYIAWSDGHNVYLIGSSDGGNTWTPPVRVNAESGTALLPWLVAGDPGRVALIWYQTNVSAPDPNAFSYYTNAKWRLYYAMTPNALSSNPVFYEVVVSGGQDHVDGIVHRGAICTQGLACPEGSRNLAEYSSFTIGLNGMPYIVFSADVNTTSGFAQVYFTKQVVGLSLFAPANARIMGSGYINNFADYFSMRIDSAGSGVKGYVYFLDMRNNLLFTTSSINTLDLRGDEALITGTGVLNDGRSKVNVAFVIKVYS